MKKKINPLAQIKKMGMTQHLFQEKKILIVLSVVVVIATALTVWNAIALQEAVKRNTQRYVNDVSLQLADDIDFRLKNNIQNLKAMVDSLLRTEYEKDEPATVEYLARKAQEMGFNALAVIRRDGSVLSTDEIGNDLLSLSGVQASLQGEDGVSILDEQSLLYSVPFYQEDQIVAVLAGVRDKANMQALIEPKSFSGQGLTCIVHQDGKVVISPTVVDMFSQLDSIFMSQSNTEVTENILKMQEDMKQNRGGIFSFTAVDGSDLILSYDPLNSYHWVLLTLVPEDLISGKVDGFITQTFFIVAGVILVFWVLLVVLFRTDRRHYRQLEELSLVDHVTKGMNNLAFQIHCTQLLEEAAPNTSAIALLNIKNFKLINENFGSADGDRVLLHVMRVLEKSVDEDEVAARADADNFFLYLRESDPDAIRVRLGKITEMVNSYFCSGMEERHHLTIQQGVYVIDDPSLEITVMQDRAKTAYQNRTADEEGLCVFYDAAFTKRIQAENDLNDLFDTSLKNGDFHVFLQPKVWLSTEKVAGAEALVRWLHPQRGMIQPSDFIPLFEKNGKICRLDLFVFEQVCILLSERMKKQQPIFPISVNLSRRHFKDPDFLSVFQQTAQRYQVPAEWIEFELTESLFFDDQGIETVKRQIDEMHRMGFRCSLDDFGMGYSSLGLLMEFEVDVIKLDKRFFLNVNRKKTRDVVTCVVNLSKQLHAEVVAEGIESEEQLEFLRATGCEIVQGYIFSKPLSLEDFECWLSDHQ